MKKDTIPIQDFIKTTTQTITNIKIKIANVVLFTSADIIVECFDANGNFVDVKYLLLSGDQYLSWPEGDDYIVSFVCNSLGLTTRVVEPTTEEITVEETPVEPTTTEETPVEPIP